MKDIKVVFKGNKTPSGYNSNTEYSIGEKYLSNLQDDGRFDIEVLSKLKVTPKQSKKTIKSK
jgi:hypothetical protein|tara:strand:+ start:368 stop:553 length:186 start_codon:yes stop_codon:yes gene_type:complete